MTEVTAAPTHFLVTTIEVKDARCIGITPPERHRTPIVAVLSRVDDRSLVTVTRSRKEDAVAVRASNLIPLLATLGGPAPGAVFF